MTMANNNDNKVLNVPHLRFPEFTGGVEVFLIGKRMQYIMWIPI